MGNRMNPVLVVTCPAGAVTGGPEALHQLVDMANTVKPGSAAICYAPFENDHVTPEPYRMYNTPIIRKDDIPSNALIVLPEIWLHFVDLFTQPCAFWWLSVDNFASSRPELLSKVAVHLTQSEYARQHVINTLGVEPLMVTDYINASFKDRPTVPWGYRVAVNPVKGKHLIDEFKKQFPKIEVIELTGMTRDRAKEELAKSKVYIDFGHHPGRDRLPREAALLETVVMTTRLGSAKNDIDIPIDDWYKFNDVSELGPKVNDIFDHFDAHQRMQANYRRDIWFQKVKFKSEVTALLQFSESLGND